MHSAVNLSQSQSIYINLDPYIVGKPCNGGINGYFTFEHGLYYYKGNL
jgi:hypothetical protein